MDNNVQKFAITLWESIGTTISTELVKKLRDGDHDYIANCKIDPASYSNPWDFWRDYQSVELLRKYAGLTLKNADPELAAQNAFFEGEKQCYWTNERLTPFIYGASQDEGLLQLIAAVRKEVRFLLGSWTIPETGKFGKGATYSDRGMLSLLPDKLSSRPTRTPNCVGPLFNFIETMWASLAATRYGCLFDVIPGNRFTTVPKNALTHRGICIEASINGHYQLGYGTLMRERLRRAGLDLVKGQDKHQVMAKMASRDGSQATIDIKQASDTVAKELVRLLLPDDWHFALAELRAPVTEFGPLRGVHNRNTVVLEKFSSMGNGYTFELETTLFAAICGGVIRLMGGCPEYGKNVSVYGDDIIVDTVYAPNVLAALRFFGFEPNDRKTFVDGSFRESCGGDFFNGFEVPVVRMTEVPEEPADWISLANRFRSCWFDDVGKDWIIGATPWFHILDQIPRNIRQCRGPKRLGDVVIHDRPSAWQVHWDLTPSDLGLRRKAKVPVHHSYVKAPAKSGQPFIAGYRTTYRSVPLVDTLKHPLDLFWDCPPNSGDYPERYRPGRNSVPYVKTWRPVTTAVKWGNWIEDVMLATRVYSVGDLSQGFTGRNSVSGYKHGWASVS